MAKGQQLLVKVPPPEHLIKEAPSAIDPDSSKLQPYLLGAWQEVWVDPNAWAIGPLPVSHFVVKAAARRVLLMGLRAEDPEFSVIHGHRPRLWPGADGSGGLLAMERRWQDLFAGKSVSLRVRDRSGRRRLEGAAAVVQTVAVVTGRVHPLERAAAAAAQRGQHAEGFADASDALQDLRGVVLEGPIQHPAWHAAYESLTLPRLDRLTRHFGWRLLHAWVAAVSCSSGPLVHGRQHAGAA